MKVSTEIDNNFGYEKITQLVDNIPLKLTSIALLPIQTCSMSDVFGCFMLGEELYVESEYSETVQILLIEIYDDFELIDKYRFDRQSIMMICDMLQDDLERSTFRNRAYFFLCFIYMIFPYSH